MNPLFLTILTESFLLLLFLFVFLFVYYRPSTNELHETHWAETGERLTPITYFLSASRYSLIYMIAVYSFLLVNHEQPQFSFMVPVLCFVLCIQFPASLLYIRLSTLPYKKKHYRTSLILNGYLIFLIIILTPWALGEDRLNPPWIFLAILPAILLVYRFLMLHSLKSKKHPPVSEKMQAEIDRIAEIHGKPGYAGVIYPLNAANLFIVHGEKKIFVSNYADEKLDFSEVSALIHHEFAHTTESKFTIFLKKLFDLYTVLSIILFYALSYIAGMYTAIIAVLILNPLVRTLMMKFYHQQEFRADRIAAEKIGSNEDFIASLETIVSLHPLQHPSSGSATHPSIQKRAEALDCPLKNIPEKRSSNPVCISFAVPALSIILFPLAELIKNL